MENTPMYGNPYPPRQPYPAGANYAPQPPMQPVGPVPPEVQQHMSKTFLKKADNRICVLLMLMQVFAVPVLLVICIFWVMFNINDIMPYVRNSDVTGVTDFLKGQTGMMMALSALATFGAMLITILVGRAMLKQKIFGAWRRPQSGPLVFFAGIAMMLAFSEVGSILVNLITMLLKQAGIKTGTPDFNLSGNRTSDLILLAYVCVIGPILEETLFRGMILQSLRPWGDWFAIVASAILFGLFHLNLIQAIPAALMGLALGFVAVKCESILPTILMHIFNNSLSMVLTMKGIEKNQTVQAIYLAIIGVAVLATILLAVFKRSEVETVMRKPASAPPVRNKYPVFFFQSPGFWVLVSFFILYGVFLANSTSTMITH